MLSIGEMGCSVDVQDSYLIKNLNRYLGLLLSSGFIVLSLSFAPETLRSSAAC
jgi:hypothetical protein